MTNAVFPAAEPSTLAAAWAAYNSAQNDHDYGDSDYDARCKALNLAQESLRERFLADPGAVGELTYAEKVQLAFVLECLGVRPELLSGLRRLPADGRRVVETLARSFSGRSNAGLRRAIRACASAGDAARALRNIPRRIAVSSPACFEEAANTVAASRDDNG